MKRLVALLTVGWLVALQLPAHALTSKLRFVELPIDATGSDMDYDAANDLIYVAVDDAVLVYNTNGVLVDEFELDLQPGEIFLSSTSSVIYFTTDSAAFGTLDLLTSAVETLSVAELNGPAFDIVEGDPGTVYMSPMDSDGSLVQVDVSSLTVTELSNGETVANSYLAHDPDGFLYFANTTLNKVDLSIAGGPVVDSTDGAGPVKVSPTGELVAIPNALLSSSTLDLMASALGGPAFSQDGATVFFGEATITPIDTSTFQAGEEILGCSGGSGAPFEVLSSGGFVSLGFNLLCISSTPAPPQGGKSCDVNGDGRGDPIIGDPLSDFGSGSNDGGIHEYHGAFGFPEFDRTITQNTTGVLDSAQAGDRFGSVTVCGDFDKDGFDDVAVGVPRENHGTAIDAGAVNVLPGSGSGITAVDDQFWHQDVTGVVGSNETGDRFGSALASGDFNGDGFDDLAVGAPGEDITATDDGSVTVLFGSASGLVHAGNYSLHQSTPGVLGTPADGDGFGYEMTVGDFDNDGFDDLAVGLWLKDVGNDPDAGLVAILYGSASGVNGDRDQTIHQENITPAAVGERADHFGRSMSVGDFNGDGYSDLLIGTPEEDLSTVIDAGAWTVVYGSATGLDPAVSWTVDQNSPGVASVAASFERFGWTAAAGDFNGDGIDDAAVGARLGTTGVFFGESSAGLTASADTTIENLFSFSVHRSLWSDDITGEGFGDLISMNDVGSVWFGSYDGIPFAESQLLSSGHVGGSP